MRAWWATVWLSGCGWLWGAEAPRQDGVSRAEVWGLQLGASTADDVAAWAAARGLVCTTAPSPRRLTTRMRCDQGLSPETLPDRTIHGELSELLVAWPDGGKVHFVSTWRRYSRPSDALLDYTTASEALRGQLGEPTTAMQVPDPSALEARMLRFGTRWASEELQVDLELSRLGADYLTVSEVWSVPGVEEQVDVRQRWGSTGATKTKGDEAK